MAESVHFENEESVRVEDHKAEKECKGGLTYLDLQQRYRRIVVRHLPMMFAGNSAVSAVESGSVR